MAALKLADLEKAPVLTTLRDKYGMHYFKLQEGTWATDELTIVSSQKLAKNRPEYCD